MVRIRLARIGLKKQPSYRVVVIDSERARDSRYIESIGFYNPRTQPEAIAIKEDRALYWLSVGAQPSDPVRHLLTKTGTLERLKRLRAGEALDVLVAEAQAQAEKLLPASGKTRFEPPAQSSRKKAEAEAAPAEAEQE